MEAKDKWELWQQEKFPEMFEAENYLSGAACDHYNRFSEDFDFAKEMGMNAHRLSIEWSRIEPEEGKFDEKVSELMAQSPLAQLPHNGATIAAQTILDLTHDSGLQVE